MKSTILFALLFSGSVFAGSCDNLYPKGVPIEVRNTTELCSSFFVVAYDKKIKGPIVSFEKFDTRSGHVARHDAFRPDTRISPNDRAELSDFSGSGYDRGHMTPAADASSDKDMYDTFALSNMTFQNKRLNEVRWRLLEQHARTTVPGVTYAANGAIYGKEVVGGNNVGLPIQYYKIIWYSNGTSEAFLTTSNDDNAMINPVQISKINSMTGIQFPTK